MTASCFSSSIRWKKCELAGTDPIIREVPLNKEVGSPYGEWKADITYSGLDHLPDKWVVINGINGITEEIQPAEGNVLALRLKMPTQNGGHVARGGTALFQRYALQGYMIEEGKPPQENGAPGGDRLKKLREIHANMEIGDGKKAAEWSRLEVSAYPKEYKFTEDKDDSLNKNHIFIVSPQP